jgi:DNA repair protein RecO (recombination protein O)
MTHKTRGIVLRPVKYGETSLVVSIFTELFGLQTYLVNGARSAKKTGTKAILLQPASLLDMEVYHQEQKNMHRIKECTWSYLYKNIFTDVVKNSIALYMVELLSKCLKQPEQHTDLFYFCEDSLQQLDEASPAVVANFALFYTLQLSHFFGFRIQEPSANDLKAAELFLDLMEGSFTQHAPPHKHFLTGEDALISAQLLQTRQPAELEDLKLHHQTRRQLIAKYLDYYSMHLQDFGTLKSLTVMQTVLG